MMVKRKQGLETLEIWQRSMDFAVDVCQHILPFFPPEEKWALNSQLRRAAQSIPAISLKVTEDIIFKKQSIFATSQEGQWQKQKHIWW